jgi:hypothetical protein
MPHLLTEYQRRVNPTNSTDTDHDGGRNSPLAIASQVIRHPRHRRDDQTHRAGIA